MASLILPFCRIEDTNIDKLIILSVVFTESLLEKMSAMDDLVKQMTNEKTKNNILIEEGLASWGKDIVEDYIKPINNILENMSEISDVSDRSLSPILSDLPKCKYCTCGEDSFCICIKCHKTRNRSVTPDEMTLIDSDVATCISYKKQKLDFEIVPGVSNHLVYKAFQQEEQNGTKFIFGIDELMAELAKDKVKIGIVKGKSISNLRAKIFDENIFKITGKHIKETYDASLTHVVIDKGYDYDDVEQILFKWCDLSHPFPFHIVNEEWLVEFSKNKSVPDETNYLFLRAEKEEIIQVNIDTESENGNDEVECDNNDSGDNNRHIIEIFNELAEIYEYKLINESHDGFKSRAYKTACAKLMKLPHIDYVENIPTHIWREGSKMWEHIKEIIETGTCEKLKYCRNHPDIISNRALTKIHGIGPQRARDLMNAGYRSIADLRTEKGVNSLRPLERICLSCYEDLQERIPRDEVKEFVEIVETNLKKQISNTEVIAAGSFRRGSPTCGDIDILIMVPDEYDGVNIITLLHEKLGTKCANLFVYDLTTITVNSTNYMCIGKLPKSGSLYRRIDIKVYPMKQFPFALSAFTGSDHWNRSLRYFARKKGFSLSDKGLYVKSQDALDYLLSVGRKTQAECSAIGHYVPDINDERDIFLTLGLEIYYKQPHERNGSIFQ